jgi:glycosyltransferase involved in cell wall biosynthesis
VVVAAHPDSLEGWHPSIAPIKVEGNRPIRVAILGALSPMKGPDILEEAVIDAHKRALPITFKLFGYAYRALAENNRLEIHGKYDPSDLPTLLDAWKPDIVWFPALWPETYSYTLSECFRLGLPVLVSNLGALADRIENRPHSWALPWHFSGREWNDQIIELNQKSAKEIEAHFDTKDAATFYLETYLPKNWQKTRQNNPGLPAIELLEKTRYRELNHHQISKLKTLEMMVNLRGHPSLAWLAKRVPMTLQRRLKNYLLSR